MDVTIVRILDILETVSKDEARFVQMEEAISLVNKLANHILELEEQNGKSFKTRTNWA
jgi:hypothetical protein